MEQATNMMDVVFWPQDGGLTRTILVERLLRLTKEKQIPDFALERVSLPEIAAQIDDVYMQEFVNKVNRMEINKARWDDQGSWSLSWNFVHAKLAEHIDQGLSQ